MIMHYIILLLDMLLIMCLIHKLNTPLYYKTEPINYNITHEVNKNNIMTKLNPTIMSKYYLIHYLIEI
jgi:hypothetical protein